MQQGPPNQPNGGGMGYMGGPPQQGPPPSYGNVPPPHNQHYGNMPTQQPQSHAYGNSKLSQNVTSFHGTQH